MEDIERIASWLPNAESAVVFTGAGISTESGVPDYRSPGGIWANSKPVYYEDYLNSAEARHEYWRQKAISHRDFILCEPNQGHRILAEWEACGWLFAVITQNIDEYHQEAGSQRVIELHGTARQIQCLECERRFDANAYVTTFLQTNQVPNCPDCGGLLKHATISFGQALVPATIELAAKLSREADLFLVLGSSLVVHPAASLPQMAKRNGARLVIINRERTPLDDVADVIIRDEIGPTLAAIHRCIKK